MKQLQQSFLDGCPRVALTLDQVIADYLEDRYSAGRSEETIRLYTDTLDQFRRYVLQFGCLTMQSISMRVCRRYFADMQRRKLSEWTVDSRWRTLHAFFEWCIWQEVLARNPLDKVTRPPKPKPKDRRVPRLSKHEIEQVLDAAEKYTMHPERNVAMIWLMGDSGLRRGEVVRLNVRDINVRTIDIWNTKGKKDRAVPIGVEARLALKRWLRVRHAPDTPALFTSRGGRITGNAILLMLRKLRDKVGLDRLYPHLLRHSFAQFYLNTADGDLRSLADILGHEDVETTAMIYTEPNTRELCDKHRQHAPSSRMKRR